ncbi:alpha/beta fold hydrolase [Microbacterium sp. RD1]|uniref:alpha/beta fold hydrolase n=1 Tax=Microbacterium sp. RD1 TaxID=3457313 RepID=UPI003FA604DF
MRLATRSVGDGPKRAALVHGIFGDGGVWFEFVPWLAAHGYTVTLVDLRGHGASDRASSYLTEDLADDLVDTLPAGMDLLVGHSLGGRAVLDAVERLGPRRAVYLDPGWTVPRDFVFALPSDESGRIPDVDELAAILPGYSRTHVENAHRALQLVDPAWVAAPNPVVPDIEPPTPPAVPSLLVLADPAVAVTPALQRRAWAGGYEVRVVPRGRHDLHILNLEATSRALDGWV